MKRLVLGILFSAAFFVLLFLAFFQDGSSRPAAASPSGALPASAPDPAAGPRPAPLETSAADPSSARETVSVPKGSPASEGVFFGWRGVVLLPDGTPAAGARVLARSNAQSAWARADEQGSFRLPWRKEKGFPTVAIRPEKQGFLGQLLFESPGQPATQVTLHLRGGRTPVVVHVVDHRDDSPVAGVVVILDIPEDESGSPWIASATSDREGLARLYVPEAGPFQVFTGLNPVAESVESSDHVLKEGAGSLELTLRVRVLPSRIRLLARDAASGLPLADAVFQIARKDGSGRVLPATRGLLDFRVPEKDRPARILVRAAGHDPCEVILPEEFAEVFPVDLPALQTHPVLVTREGRPTGPFTLEWSWEPDLVYGPVVLRGGSESFWNQPLSRIRGRTETKRDGSADLPVPTAKNGDPLPLSLVVRAPDGSEERVLPNFLGSEMPELGGRWLIELHPETGRVIVEVAGDRGIPLAGYQVIVQVKPVPDGLEELGYGSISPPKVDWNTRIQAGLAGKAVTGADGRTAFDLRAPGRLSWQVRQGSWETHGEESESLHPGEERLVRVVRPLGSDLSGIVVGADGRPPGKEVHVTVEKAGRDPSEWNLLNLYVRLNPDGTFRVKDLAPGRYRIAAQAGSAIRARTELAFPATREVRLELPPNCGLAVLVVDAETGDPIPQATVEVASRLGTRKGSTDGQGHAAFADLAELALSVKVTAPAHAVWLEDYPAGPPPESAELRVALDPGRTLIVEVELPQGAPHPPAAWRLEELPPDHPAQRSIRILRDGKQVFLQGIPIRALTLRALDAEGRPLDPPLKIPAGTLGQRLTWSPGETDSR